VNGGCFHPNSTAGTGAGGALVDRKKLVTLGHDVTLFASGRFPDVRQIGRNLAQGPASRRRGPRSQCVAHGDAGARPPRNVTMRNLTSSTFISTTIRFSLFLPAADTVPDHAWHGPARSSGAPAGVLDLSRRFPVISISNAQRRPVPAGELGAHHPSRPAARNLLTPLPAEAGNISPCSAASRPEKGCRSRHQDRHALRHSA